MTTRTHRFTIEVEVPDDHHTGDDAEWWADAAAGALVEYGGTATFHLGETTTRHPFPTEDLPAEEGPIPCPFCTAGTLRHIEDYPKVRDAAYDPDTGTVWFSGTSDDLHVDEGTNEHLECNHCVAEFDMPEEYDFG